jgi:hypothetical protein
MTLFPYPSQGVDADERFTPSWVFDGMGLTFDLDPASPIGIDTVVPARLKLTRDDDGLSSPWHGLVWCNPPFSTMTKWADRFIEHGSGVLLGPIADSGWMNRAMQACDAVYIMRDLRFWHPTHKGKESAYPLALWAFGVEALAGITRASQLWGPDRGTLLNRSATSFENR